MRAPPVRRPPRPAGRVRPADRCPPAADAAGVGAAALGADHRAGSAPRNAAHHWTQVLSYRPGHRMVSEPGRGGDFPIFHLTRSTDPAPAQHTAPPCRSNTGKTGR